MPNSSRIPRRFMDARRCWSRHGCAPSPAAPHCDGLDPGQEAGIVVAALGDDGHGYMLEDLSIRGSPATWAGQAIAGYHKYKANLIVAEANHGGDMVITTIATQDSTAATKKVWASQGKYARAEPFPRSTKRGGCTMSACSPSWKMNSQLGPRRRAPQPQPA